MQKAVLHSLSVFCLFAKNNSAVVRASDLTAAGMGDHHHGDQGSSGDVSTSGIEDNDKVGYEQISMWDGIDVLVVAFFAVAAVWLFVSIIYSVILLLLLKLQAQGRLDLDDENFGQLKCCNGFFNFDLGCIARRYAVRMTRNESDSPQHTITRIERRAALEVILKTSTTPKDVVTDVVECSEKSGEVHIVDGNETLCSICLSGYENDHVVITTKCGHQFHKACLMDWLERRNNSECPVCRETLIAEGAIWEKVQTMRKSQRKTKGLLYRVARFIVFSDSTNNDRVEGSPSNSMTDNEEMSDVEHATN
ncbi:unnamed protein product [Cylindrotheca closterium]|uniref:RING-type domain-containing protein n=1 Tax=Cylindrotheca closterium TaxID=2856 RepID=A0AAD2JNC7_9STRA|nr:unnamed protein product [Cylindrotheca closterium]